MMKKDVVDYLVAVELLIDVLECMIEEGSYNEDKLMKRIKVVKEFKLKFINALK